MSDLPRIPPVPVEAWSGSDADPTPLWRRVAPFAVPFVGMLLLCAYLPSAVPWVLGVVGVVTVVRVVREVRQARRQSASRP